ncbi:MAG: efflux RND transporter periplasmic adaptor subunit [Polyangiales bacterium]
MTVPSTQDPFEDLGKPRGGRWRWVLFALVVVALVGYAVVKQRQKPKTIQYVTAAATLGDVQETVETSGTVQPLVQVQVGSQVSGRIARVLVDFNHRVRAGQLLAEIDPTPFRASVAQARAQVMSAEAQLQRARANEQLAATNLHRAEDLRARGLNAQSDVDQARGTHAVSRADVAVATAEIARARASLQSVETNLANTRIVSPIDGVVIQRSIDEGQTVAASFQAPVLFLLAGDLTRMRIMANIDEADIAKLREHLQAEARVDAFQGEVFRGEVTEVRFGSTTTSGVVTYPAVVTVDNPALKLRPGMTATITVTSNRHQGVLRVPNAALRYEPGALAEGADAGVRPRRARDEERGDGGTEAPVRRGAVYVLENGAPRRVRVRIGLVDEALTEVSGEGLSERSQVIVDEIDTTPASGRAPAAAFGGGGRRPR